MLCLLVLATLVLAFFWRYVTPDASARILFPTGDFIEQYYPWRFYGSFELAQGRLPLWTPFSNSGHPFLADIQTAVFYPPHLILSLVLWLRGDPQLTILEFEWLVVSHLFLAGAFTYLFVRAQTNQPLAGLASALVFAFGSYLTTYPLLQPSILEVATWIPLVLFLVAKAASRRSLPLWVLVGAVLAVPTLAGHPQQAIYLYYLVGAFGLLAVLGSEGPEAQETTRRIAKTYLSRVGGLALAIAISVGLASAQLLPSGELVSFSSRAQELNYEFTGIGFELKEAFGFLFPNFLGGKPMFIGTIPLLLAAASLRRPRVKGALFWAVAAAVAYLLSFGGNLPVYKAAHCCLPGFAWFQDQERAIFIFSLAGSVLLGYGLASVLGQAESQGKARLHTMAAIGTFLAAAAAAIAVASRLAEALSMPFSSSALTTDATTVAVVAGAAAVVMHLAEIGHLSRGLGMAALVTLAAGQLLAVNWGNLEPGGENPFLPTPLTAFLQGLPPDRRIELSALPSNAGNIFRLRVVRGAGPLTNKYLTKAMSSSNPRKPWPLLNTGYTVATIQQGAASPIYAYRGIGVYEMPENIAPAYVAFRVQVNTNDEEVLAALTPSRDDPSRGSFVLGRDALLSEELDLPFPPTGKGYVRSLQTIPDDGGHLFLQVDTTAPGVLVMSEVYYPGWKAFVDGKETKISRANYMLRSIDLPPGPHAVHLVYQPDSFKVGLAVSLATSLLILSVGIVSSRWQRRWKLAALPLVALVAAALAMVSWQSFPSYPLDTTPGQWEHLSQFLETNHLPGDALVVVEAGPPSWLRFPPALPAYRAGEPSDFSGHTRLWWLSSLDKPSAGPARPAPMQGWQVVSDHWFGNQLLSLMMPTEAILASAPKRLDARLGDRVALRGYGVSTEKQAGDRMGALEVTLYWQAWQSLDKDYAVFVHLLDQDGQIASQHDGQPAAGSRPTSAWESSEVVVDQHAVPLPKTLKPGLYTLIAGLYDAGSGERLHDATYQSYISLGQITPGA